MNSISFHAKSIRDLESQIMEIKLNKFHPNLAILFGSISCDLYEIPSVFNQYNIDLIGCSSAGEIAQGDIFEQGISVLLMDVNRDYYQIVRDNNTDDHAMGVSISTKGKSFYNSPSFLTFVTMTTYTERVIEGMISVIPKSPRIFGGMAGDDLKMQKTFTLSNEGVFDKQVVTLIFDEEKVEMKGRALCGWKPIGAANIITEAKGNIIYTINNQPALEVFQNYFGSLSDDSQEDILVDTIASGVTQYPLQIIKGDNTVLRAALSVDETNQSLIMAGPVQTGDKFKFSVAPGFEIIEETIHGFEEYKKENQDTDALILISCIARHMALGPMIAEEVKGIQAIWNKPLVGFFSYGEVGLDETGECHFYNETCSLVLIKER